MLCNNVISIDSDYFSKSSDGKYFTEIQLPYDYVENSDLILYLYFKLELNDPIQLNYNWVNIGDRFNIENNSPYFENISTHNNYIHYTIDGINKNPGSVLYIDIFANQNILTNLTICY